MRTVGEAKLRQQIHAEKLAGFQTEANAATERSSTGTAAGVKADRDKLWGDLIAEKMNAGR